jgi:periplasmic protein TonB
MENTIALKENSEYGAFELKKVYHKNFTTGLTIAVVIHLFIIGAYIFIESISKNDENNIPTVRILKYSELGPPPSLNDNTQEEIKVSAPEIKPNVGIPKPVPDAEVKPEQTIATQTEMNQVSAPISEGNGNGNVQITKDLKVEQDQDPDINSFVAVEKEPEVVVMAKPEYPDIAKRAGVEGTVYVKILIEKDGKPKKAVIIKSTTDIFNDVTLAAAMKCVFTPAIQNKQPVPVWIVVPFKFKLN